MGLGTKQAPSTYLSIANGSIWNRKVQDNDPNFATETFDRADGTKGIRSGARYADLTGFVKGVIFRTHKEYGQNINVTIEDDEGERFILSISTNNRYSQDMMKCLLKMDLSEELFIKPYDFTGQDGKRAQGISFRQDGNKINLKNEEAPSHESSWFKEATSKDIRRFFEDLSDWFVGEVEEKICSQFSSTPTKKAVEKTEMGESPTEAPKEQKEVAQENVETEKEEVDIKPLQMRKIIRAYIAENYPEETLPTLKGEELVKWYNLATNDEELPFEVSENETQTSEGSVDDQISALLDDKA